MPDIYSDSQRKQSPSSPQDDYIIYLDNYIDITLGQLIQETKQVLSTMSPDAILVLMVTNTHESIERHISYAYHEFGSYVQNLINKGAAKIAIIFRGIILSPPSEIDSPEALKNFAHTTLLNTNTEKYVSSTALCFGTVVANDQKFMQKFNLNIL